LKLFSPEIYFGAWLGLKTPGEEQAPILKAGDSMLRFILTDYIEKALSLAEYDKLKTEPLPDASRPAGGGDRLW